MAPSGIIAPGPAAGGAGAGTLVPPIAPLLFMPMVPGKENWGIILVHTQSDGVCSSPQSHKTLFHAGTESQSIKSFALSGQDQLMLFYSMLCFLSHEYFLLLAWEITLTEFLNKKPIKWDHWKKSPDFVRGNEYTQEQRILLPPIPICPIRMSGGSLWKDRHSFQLIIRLLKMYLYKFNEFWGFTTEKCVKK